MGTRLHFLRHRLALLALLLPFLLLTACGGGGGDGETTSNSPPTASGVAITPGSAVVGDTLTGSYTYRDTDGDSEGASTFRWLRNGVAISGATAATYTVVAADSGQGISFEVTPVAATGTRTGTPVTSGAVVIDNSPPTVSDVSITDNNGGSPVIGDTLTGAYFYNDVEGDYEGTSIYRWLRNGMAIGGATSQSYTLVAADNGQSITFEVTPVAISGASPGTPVASTSITPALDSPTLSLNVAIKQLQFSWSAVANATYYKLFQNTDGGSGFTQVGTNLIGTTTYNVDIAVHSQDWANARYLVQACNGYGCTASSNEVTTLGAMLSSIGYVKASNSAANDKFGVSVAISDDGNTLVVGAFGEDSNFTGVSTNGAGEADNSVGDAGAVYVFTRSGAAWTQQAYIKASNTGIQDYFGRSLALSGDGSTLAVGAWGEDSNFTGVSTNGAGEADNSASDSGAVYVFTRSGSSWTQQAYVKASNTGIGDRFGYVVALSDDGNTLAVGAYGEDSNATGISTNGTGEADNSASGAGAVYVFTRSGSSWTQQAYVKASNTGAADYFGRFLSLNGDGNTLAVGAYGEDSNGTGQADNSVSMAGAVYVFTRSGSSWTQQAYVKASSIDANDVFGFGVSLSNNGNTLVVGAYGEDSNATGVSTDGTGEADNSASMAGAVYVFNRSGGVWTQQAYIKASNTQASDRFGFTMALGGDGNNLAVGAWTEGSSATGVSTDGSGESDNSATLAGAVYVFTRSGSSWTQQAYVKASNTGAYDYFSFAIAISRDGNSLAVGAYGEDSSATGVSTGASTSGSDNSADASGAVYLY